MALMNGKGCVAWGGEEKIALKKVCGRKTAIRGIIRGPRGPKKFFLTKFNLTKQKFQITPQQNTSVWTFCQEHLLDIFGDAKLERPVEVDVVL